MCLVAIPRAAPTAQQAPRVGGLQVPSAMWPLPFHPHVSGLASQCSREERAEGRDAAWRVRPVLREGVGWRPCHRRPEARGPCWPLRLCGSFLREAPWREGGGHGAGSGRGRLAIRVPVGRPPGGAGTPSCPCPARRAASLHRFEATSASVLAPCCVLCWGLPRRLWGQVWAGKGGLGGGLLDAQDTPVGVAGAAGWFLNSNK